LREKVDKKTAFLQSRFGRDRGMATEFCERDYSPSGPNREAAAHFAVVG